MMLYNRSFIKQLINRKSNTLIGKFAFTNKMSEDVYYTKSDKNFSLIIYLKNNEMIMETFDLDGNLLSASIMSVKEEKN